MAQRATTATDCCLKTEIELSRIAGGLYQSIQRNGRTFGTAAAIEDNRGGSLTAATNPRKAIPDGAPGTGVKVDIKYALPDCAETATAAPGFDCTDETPSAMGYGYEEFYFDNAVGEKFTVSQALFDNTCEDTREELARKLAYHVESMYSKYNSALTTELAASVGSTYYEPAGVLTSVTPAELKLFRLDASGASVPQPMAIYDLVHEYERQNPAGGRQPVIIGGTKALGAFQMGNDVFRGNTDGLDAGNITNPLRNIYMDWQLPTIVPPAVAANPVLSFLPGSIELVEFWEFDNDEKMIADDGRITWAPVQASGTLIRQKVDVGTPVIGRPFVVDMQIKYDECTNQVTYTMRKDFGLFKIPQAAFCAGTTWNYNMLWNVTCDAYNCADVL